MEYPLIWKQYLASVGLYMADILSPNEYSSYLCWKFILGQVGRGSSALLIGEFHKI